MVHYSIAFGLQAEDNSVSRDELTAVLLSSLESAHTILDNVEDAEQPEEGSGTDKLIETVTRLEALIFLKKLQNIVLGICYSYSTEAKIKLKTEK